MGSKSTMIVLQSCDGQSFEVEEDAVIRSPIIAKKLRKSDHSDNSPVVLDNIDGETLEKVVKYCIHRHKVADSRLGDEAFVNSLLDDDFDEAEFVNVDQTTFFNLLEAAHALKIRSLIDLTCGALSKKIKGKNYKEIEALAENWI